MDGCGGTYERMLRCWYHRGVASTDTHAVRTIEPERVARVRDDLLTLDDATRLSERFRLLAEPGRLRMIYALLEAGEMCVCDLAATIESSESATSHQLRQLRLAGLVRSRRDGRTVHYRVADTHVRLLLDVAVEHYLHDHDTDGT